MSAEQIPEPERLPLPEYICRRIHDYEWKPTSGTHSPMPRRNPCVECGDMAALVVEWLAGEVAGPIAQAAS